MLKSLILIVLFLNVAFAKERFTEAERKKFLDDVKVEIAQHKTENQGHVDLQIIKPGFYAELEELIKHEQITRNESMAIKQRYEFLSKDKSITTDKTEEAFYNFITKEFGEASSKPIEKIKEGSICNAWSCEEGLKCAPDPIQLAIGKLKKSGEVCLEGSECASSECYPDKPGSKTKICEDVYRCFKPLSAGESCSVNPVCGVGTCLPYNSQTSGIGECVLKDNFCKKNSDCCSNSCQQGICKQNFICKDCIQNSGRPQRGQKCCEGLYLNEKGMCVPDLPPSVLPQVKFSPLRNFLIAISNFIIPSAEAGTVVENIGKSFDAAFLKIADKPAGTSINWGTGKITIVDSEHISFSNPYMVPITLSENTNIIKAANASPGLRMEIINQFGIDPLSTKEGNDSNKAFIDTLLSGSTKGTVAVNGFPGQKIEYDPATGKVTSFTGKVYETPESFKNSNEYAALTGKNLTAADYADLRDEAASVAAPGSTASSNTLEDDEIFLNAGAKDNSRIYDTIKADKDKFSNFTPKSTENSKDNIDLKNKTAAMIFNKKSDFATCDIHFKDDFYNGMKKNNQFDLEVAMLAFDFVTTGDADNDYWTKDKTSGSSIYGRLKKIGLAHRATRQINNQQFEEFNKKLTCACIDVIGPDKLKDEAKKKFFNEQCPAEATKYNDPNTPKDQLTGDASSIKEKELIVLWTKSLLDFHMAMAVTNEGHSKDLREVYDWVSNADWKETRTKNYDLFKFNIKNPSSSTAMLGGIVGALLAAGVIAILGGFGTTSLLSAWGAAGIITATAVTGAGGLWMVASLKGAWITMRPQISDSVIAPKTYSCGKKETCKEYTRTLVQPYNDICNIHASANACLKSFVVVKEGIESRYIVDPWIPVGVSKISILRNQPNYAEKLDKSFEAAKAAMIGKNPGAKGGGGKKGGGEFVSESYLEEIFIDETIVGRYVPGLGMNLEDTYYLNAERVKLIKDAAKKFAIDEKFLEADDTFNLDQFADYAYEYHFLWPKKSSPDEISYPTVGLKSYMNYIANDVSGNLATGLVKDSVGIAKTYNNYLNDLKATLIDLADKPINQLGSVSDPSIINTLPKVKQEQTNLASIMALLDNASLDTRLSSLGSSMSSEQLKSMGLSGDTSLNKGQISFMKAVGNLRTDRKKQLRALDSYKKTMASSGNTERAIKMESASKSFSDKFSKGKFAFGNGMALSNSGGSGTNSANAVSGTDAKSTSDKDGSGNFLSSGGKGLNSAGGVRYGAGSGSSSGSGNGTGSSSEAAVENAGAHSNGTDQQSLADAISARDLKGKNKYESTEEQTIFEKITNAYIRNYDKILTKKKDKDVIEDKR
jgi:hypothetical protein